MFDEEYFPRGGKPYRPKISKKREFENNLFDEDVPSKRKKHSNENYRVQQVLLKSIDKQPVLALNDIREDMIVLSCIRSISYNCLEVELPGFLIAKVKIQNISDVLNKDIERALTIKDEENKVFDLLENMFNIGDYVPFKVTEVKPDEHRLKIYGSINPKDINKEQRFMNFKQGQLLWGSIKSTSDHGLEVDIGVENCRVFLPYKNMDIQEYNKGQLIWCSIQDITDSGTVSTLQVSSRNKHVDRVFYDNSISLSSLLPGTKVQFVVDKHLEHGLSGTFLNNFCGYISEIFFNSPLQNLADINQSEISAYVLYTQDITKVTYLSLRGLERCYDISLKKGDKLSCKIISKQPTGIYLKLQGGLKGYAVHHNLINSEKSSDKNLLKPKYALGSKHPCVVLDYNHLSRLYKCTLDQRTLKEKYFIYKDFAISDIVEGVIEQHDQRGLVFKVGQVKGFIPNDHISDLKFSQSLKKKYQVGKRMKARVLNIKNDNVIFTIKPTFLNNDIHLCSLDQATKDSIFYAMVLLPKLYGVQISFFGNIEGFVSFSDFNLNISAERYQQNISEFFYRGQIVKVRVKSVKKDGVVQASLNLAPSLGSTVMASVKEVITEGPKKGLSLEILKTNIPAFLPINHLSAYKNLCAPILTTFTSGDKITDLLCISSNNSEVVLSRKEKLGCLRQQSKIYHIKELKEGKCIRCFINTVEKNRVVLTLPVKGFHKNVFIKLKNIDPIHDVRSMLEPDQTVIGKVLHVNRPKKEINLTLKFTEIFSRNRQQVLNYFNEYFNDLEFLRQHGLKNNWKITDYNVGEKVSCKVVRIMDQTKTEINAKGFLLKVKLPNGSSGIGHISPNSRKPKIGSMIAGVVVGHDYLKLKVELTFHKSLVGQIVSNQDVVLSNSACYMATKILTKNDYILGVVHDPSRQMVYLPMHLHENNFIGLQSFYESKKFKIIIIGSCNNRLVGVPYKYKDILKLKVSKSKNIQEINISNNFKVTDNDGKINKTSLANKLKKNKIIKTNALIQDSDVMEILDEENFDEKIHDKEQLSDEEQVSDEEQLSNKEQLSDEEQLSAEEQLSDEGNYDDNEFSNNSNDENATDDDSNEEAENLASSDRLNEDKNKEFVGTISPDDGYVGTSEEIEEEVKSQLNSKSEWKKSSNKSCLSVLPSINNFFTLSNEDVLGKNLESSDDEVEDSTPKKKKKLTAAERVAEMRKAEERISKIEKELADSQKNPESAEQFDRLLLATPHSSALWIKYISFHLSSAEFDKARTVAKRALETIDMTLTEEKFNIWLCLLRLENMYGTKDSFEKIFDEAVRFNDALKVYLNTLDILMESGKTIELEEKILKLKAKYKQEPEMWLSISKIYYQLGKFDEARNIKNACFKSITNPKQQLELIIKFANLEFKYGEVEIGSAIFETVLQQHPTKINFWITYFNQLKVKNLISDARQVLDRALQQKLNLKSLKTLFREYKTFEEKYGDKETLSNFEEKSMTILKKFGI